MEITLTLKDLGFIAIVVCVVILLVQCICLVRNLVKTVKRTNEILDDSAVISGIAAERVKEVNETVGDATDTVKNLVNTIKGQQSTIAALTTIINGITSLRNLLSKQAEEKESESKENKEETEEKLN